MTPDALIVFASLIRFLTDPKTSQTILGIFKDVTAFALATRDRFVREGSWEHQDAQDRLNVQLLQRFTELRAQHMADGVFTDEERLELKAAWDAMVDALKALPA